ncbi:MAG: hypothetical protein WC854_11560 [Bacteroidales bacterium]
METLIIKPKDKAELNFFLELAERLGAKASTIESDADERLFQAMEKNKKTSKVSRQKILDTIHQIIKE